MKNGGNQLSRILSLIIFMMIASSCNLTIEEPVSSETATTTSSTVSGTNDCTTLTDKFNSMNDCTTTTLANCKGEWESFTGGGLSYCYYPAVGWEGCALNPPTWMYTPYTIQGAMTGGYKITRSLIGCSSETCSCNVDSVDPVQLSPVDSLGVPLPFEFTDYNNSSCSLGSSCTCSIADCPWGESDIIIPNVPINSGLTAGSWTVSPWTLTPANGTSSTNNSPTISLTGGAQPGVTLKVFTDAACLHQMDYSSNPSGSTLNSSGATSAPILLDDDFTTAGVKNFYFKLSTGATNSTSCTDTGVSYTYVLAPVITSVGGLFPSNSKIPGATVTVDFYDQNTSSDLGITYSDCYYDRIVDGSTATGYACSTLPGYAAATPDFATTGSFTWVPGTTDFGPYEICMKGANVAAVAGVTGCKVYDIQPPIVTTNLVHYFDAQFSSPSGGLNLNTDATNRGTWQNLVGTLGLKLGTLQTFAYNTTSGWQGNTTLSNVVSTNSLRFDGSSDYVDFSTILDTYTKETIDAWIKPEDVTQSGSRIIFSHANTGAGTAGKGLALTQVHSGQYSYLTLSLGEASASTIKCNSSNVLSSDSWFHVTASWNPNASADQLKLYINGSKSKGCTYTSTSGSLSSSGKPLRMGYSASNTAASYWKGSIANLRVYNTSTGDAVTDIPYVNYTAEKQRFLQPNTIIGYADTDLKLWLKAESYAALADGASVMGIPWIDESYSSHDANAVSFSGPYYTTNQVNSTHPALFFDSGTSDVMTSNVGNASAYHVYVVSKVTDVNTSELNCFFGTYNTTNTDENSCYDMCVGGKFMVNTGKVVTVFGDGVGMKNKTTTTSSAIINYFISPIYRIYEKVKTATAEDIYVNGSLQTSVISGTGATASNGAASSLLLGARGSGQFLDGYIAEAVIYNRALTAAEQLSIQRYLGNKYNITVP